MEYPPIRDQEKTGDRKKIDEVLTNNMKHADYNSQITSYLPHPQGMVFRYARNPRKGKNQGKSGYVCVLLWGREDILSKEKDMSVHMKRIADKLEDAVIELAGMGCRREYI